MTWKRSGSGPSGHLGPSARSLPCKRQPEDQAHTQVVATAAAATPPLPSCRRRTPEMTQFASGMKQFASGMTQIASGGFSFGHPKRNLVSFWGNSERLILSRSRNVYYRLGQ